jgi:MoxR-like ATPase
MDIKTFIEVATALPSDISVLIRGNHGIGKSEVVHQIAKDLKLDLIDRRMSQMTEGDVIGLPKLDDGCTKFIPAEFVMIACSRPVMLFLDEINRATQEVMQACFQLCLDRELNGNKLHPGTRVFAAVNSSAIYQVNEMDPAFLDRFYAIDLTPTAQDWFAWAETAGKIDADLVRFLKERETRLEPSDANPGTVQPSRRSWARLDRAFKANGVYESAVGESDVAKGRAHSFAIGFVGVEASIELCDFLSKRETRFTAVQILSEYPVHRAKVKKLGQDKLNTLIDMIVDHAKVNIITMEEANNVAAFVQDLPGELRVSFITNYTKGTRPTPNFSVNFKTINAAVMPHIVTVCSDKKALETATAGKNDKKKK